MNNTQNSETISFPIQMYDPSRSYEKHKSLIDDSIQTVVESGQFINGPQVKELEIKLKQFTANNRQTLYLIWNNGKL